MLHRKILFIGMFGALFSLAAVSCGDETGGSGGTTAGGGGSDGGSGGSGGSAGGGTGGGGGGELKWYLGCGDPVCGGHTPEPGVDACTTEMEGAPCTVPAATCDPVNDCNAHLLCTDSDPTQQPGGCPVSRARFKHDIRYLPDAELERVRDDVLATRIASWRYNHEDPSAREHLGFIIDDNPESPSVARSGNHVDLYGYMSMAVAAIQVQDRQLRALEQETKALREELTAARAQAAACVDPVRAR